MRRSLTVIAFALVSVVAPLEAQLPIPTPGGRTGQNDSTRLARDTIKVPAFRVPPPVSPLGAAWRSLLLPGWGQAVLHRRVTGAAFVFWEGITAAMTLKAVRQLHYWEGQVPPDSATDIVKAKRQEVQDWVVLLVFNHLLAGAEAFASAQLSDFPAHLDARALPGGRTGLGIAVPIGR